MVSTKLDTPTIVSNNNIIRDVMNAHDTSGNTSRLVLSLLQTELYRLKGEALEQAENYVKSDDFHVQDDYINNVVDAFFILDPTIRTAITELCNNGTFFTPPSFDKISTLCDVMMNSLDICPFLAGNVDANEYPFCQHKAWNDISIALSSST